VAPVGPRAITICSSSAISYWITTKSTGQLRGADFTVTSSHVRLMPGKRLIWTPGAYFELHWTRAFCCMANPRRVDALLEMAEEDLAGARTLLAISTRLARYHVQQSAEKAAKALLEQRGLNPGREHRFELLAEMLDLPDPWRARIKSLDTLSPAATSHRYPTAEGRIMTPPRRDIVEKEIAVVETFIRDIRKTVGGGRV